MAKQPLEGVRSFLRRAATTPYMKEQSDADLLEQCTKDRSADAFDILMRRYSRLVWGCCQRVANDFHDAEDAFQATFLVLFRKAAILDRRRPLGNWLWGVAYRAALKANAQATRHHTRERQVTNLADYPSTSQSGGEETWRVLSAELNRLPEKYRAPLLLCYLQCKTNEQAAQELGCPIGSLSKRLARARELLRERLAARGTHLSTATLLVCLTGTGSSAAPPTALVEATSLATRLLLAGKGTIASVASSSVASLTQEVLRVMGYVNLRFVVGWALAACLTAGIGGTVLVHGLVRGAADQNTTPTDQPKTAASRAALKLPPALEQFAKVVKPRPDETQWRRIPWLTDLAKAQQVAKTEKRPLFIFVSGDDPLEAC